jgi:hypothetical protein
MTNDGWRLRSPVGTIGRSVQAFRKFKTLSIAGQSPLPERQTTCHQLGSNVEWQP